ILREPKNALTKQYSKLFELDGIELKFQDEALKKIATKSVERKTGARGLRAIMENTMMDLMYKAPSDNTICRCVVRKDMVDGKGEAENEYGEPLTVPARKPSRSRRKGKSVTA